MYLYISNCVLYNLVDRIHFNHIIILLSSLLSTFLLRLLLILYCLLCFHSFCLSLLLLFFFFLCLTSDFYPNGGRASQPGCGGLFKEILGKSVMEIMVDISRALYETNEALYGRNLYYFFLHLLCIVRVCVYICIELDRSSPFFASFDQS